LQRQRLEAALRLFDAMDVQVPDLDPALDLVGFVASSISPSGVVQIMSLPFPSQGCSQGLGMILPSELVCSVLGNISHLIQCLSETLHIPLVHSVQPFDTFDPVISAASDLRHSLPLSPLLGEEIQGSSVFDEKWPSIDKTYQAHIQRISRGQSGVLAARRRSAVGQSIGGRVHQLEKTTSSGRREQFRAAIDGVINNRNFSKAIHLLQMNVIEFCLSFGLSPSQLFPPNCLLHNLYMVRLRCLSLLREMCTSGPIVEREITLRRQLERNELMGHLLGDISASNPKQSLEALTLLYRSERACCLEQPDEICP